MTMAAVASGLGSVLGGITQAFGNQGRSPLAQVQPRVDTSTAAIAQARDRKERRDLMRNAREERLYALLTDPQVIGAVVVLGGLMVSARAPFHDDPGTNARLRGIAAASTTLMGLGRAGVGDLTSLMVAGMAGGALGLSEGGAALGPLGAKVPGTDVPWYQLALPGGLGAVQGIHAIYDVINNR